MVIICTPNEKKSLMRVLCDKSTDCPFPWECPPAVAGVDRCVQCAETRVTWMEQGDDE